MEEKVEKLGFFSRIGIAIGKPKEYYKLASKGVGNTIGTFAIITIIQTLCLIGILTTLLYSKAFPFIDSYVEKVPEFELSQENGLTIEREEPLAYSGEGMFIMVNPKVETVSELKEMFSEQIAECEDYLLVANKDAEIDNDNEVQNIVFTQIEMPTITRQNLLEWYMSFKTQILPIAIAILTVFIYLFTFILALFSGLLLSLIGLIIESAQKQSLSFGQIYNIAMYSRVTVIILTILGTSFMLSPGNWFLIKLAIEVIYMVCGIGSMKKINQAKQTEAMEIK